jgi:hypothetical protein
LPRVGEQARVALALDPVLGGFAHDVHHRAGRVVVEDRLDQDLAQVLAPGAAELVVDEISARAGAVLHAVQVERDVKILVAPAGEDLGRLLGELDLLLSGSRAG